ncbi:MAG: hypothetical protein EBR82_66350 [Caulobacteraceae bacterium]|nr:hypothetical protein [Caulobacteraceae bacterium]
MATVFNDTIFAQTAFQQLVEILTPIRAFATDISSDVNTQGSAVVVPLFGNATTTTFTQSTTVMEQTGGLLSAITVTLDKRKITPVSLTHQQLAESSNAGRWDKWAYQLGKSMGTSVLADVWSLLTTSNFGSAIITTASANYTKTQLIEARKVLKQAGARGEYSFVGNMVIEGALLGDTNLVNYFNRGDASAIKEGDLGRLFGMNVYASDIIPANSASIVGFACGQDGIAFASRALGQYLPNADFEAIEEMTDPESGLTALYTRHYSRASGTYFANMHMLYGYSVAVTNALKVFTTPTN